MKQKPTPRELVVRQLVGVDVIKLTTGSDDALQWIQAEAPQFGQLVKYPNDMYYTLFVSDIYVVREVIEYLDSYNDS